MPRYWVMAAGESKPAELFDKVWQFDLAENVISIGWKQLGDVSQMTREKLAQTVVATYSDKPSQTKGLYTNMLWAFYHDMLPGDYVIARRGRKTLRLGDDKQHRRALLHSLVPVERESLTRGHSRPSVAAFSPGIWATRCRFGLEPSIMSPDTIAEGHRYAALVDSP